jgi:hypothetical protein
MSRNLATSSCETCGYTVRLTDLMGEPIEFRKYGPYVPEIGCKFVCGCGEVYFAIWRRIEKFWSDESIENGTWKTPKADSLFSGFVDEAGKFAIERTSPYGSQWVEQTGCFVIDLSYYTTFNDEKPSSKRQELDILHGAEDPWHLCKDNALDTQWIW